MLSLKEIVAIILVSLGSVGITYVNYLAFVISAEKLGLWDGS